MQHSAGSWERQRGTEIIGEILRYSQDVFSPSGVMLTWLSRTGDYRLAEARGIKQSFNDDYMCRAQRFDPFSVERLTSMPNDIHCLSLLNSTEGPSRHIDLYESFLQDHGYRDELDLVLSDSKTPIAVLSVLNGERIDIDGGNVGAFHRFTNLFFNTHPHVERLRRQRVLGDLYGLTKREMEVVEFIRDGASNLDIAEWLDISLATVKTHVVRALDKVGAESRTALIALTNQL